MNFKSRFTKKPDSMEVLNFQEIKKQHCGLIRERYRTIYAYHGKGIPSKIKEIVVNPHCVERWNERIGPKLEEEELELMFNQLLQIPYRITTLSKEIAIIDDDIVFIYKFEEDKMIILTIYGRLSLKPSLQNLDRLKTFNYHHYDRLNLSIPERVLEEQIIPPIPVELFVFKGTKTFYRIEKFHCVENDIYYLTTFLNGRQQLRVIDFSNHKQPRLNKKVLYVLYSLGYKDFVYNHTKHYNPEKVEKYEQAKMEQRLAKKITETHKLESIKLRSAEMKLLEKVYTSNYS
ncbi:hypothetical protein [Virgibacillus halodenitrificans]|uniref:hypothetical protein n=1 Tax=Virgibacillus halodenitrificans TaxID=1482 RepID=UPI000EF549D7|nr:hypothetical protein [Virgibacillus halodenitrificans]